ncbi:MAG: hypothetical protein DME21_12135 [Verrucomicrobia bacterium]|nr:MAG: hypothetical protein DME21_12135 [Verrucomicrobiota bacterium]
MVHGARRSRRFRFQLRNIRRKSTGLPALKRAEARAPVFMGWLLNLFPARPDRRFPLGAGASFSRQATLSFWKRKRSLPSHKEIATVQRSKR